MTRHDSPFRRTRAADPGLRARVFRRPRPDSADAEIRSLLATTLPKDVYRAQIEEVFRRHSVGDRDRRRLLDELWKAALGILAGDDVITDAEAAYLTDLRSVLDISEDTAMRCESEILHPKYEHLVRRGVSDGVITDDERKQLASLASALRLSPYETTELYRKSAGELLQSTLDTATADQRLCPTEFREFGLLA